MNAPPANLPTAQDARAIVQAVLHEDARSLTRFSTGLAHFVYDVVTTSNRAVVVRIARREAAATLAGACYWSERLRPLGVPLPEILYADPQGEAASFPFLLLERLPGTDLGHVYPQLALQQKRAIVADVIRAQQLVGTLPLGHGFGYVASYDASFPHHTWSDVLLASLARSRARIVRADVFDSAFVDQLQSRLTLFAQQLARVRPTPFLDDTTTKNVLIHDGHLSGIVDVDVVCFGDPLWTIGLTRMALLSSGDDLDYVQAWCDLLELTPTQRQLLTLYTAIFCLDFMGEVGQVFNQEMPVAVDEARAQQLIAIFHALMQAI